MNDENKGEFSNIYDFVRTIPPGRVLSYGDVGRAVGATARTVGWAMGICPDGVPWQRVVGADGYLRIARRSLELKAQQRSFLESEGVGFDDKDCVLAKFFGTIVQDAEQETLNL